jgi:hypothetical protein
MPYSRSTGSLARPVGSEPEPIRCRGQPDSMTVIDGASIG